MELWTTRLEDRQGIGLDPKKHDDECSNNPKTCPIRLIAKPELHSWPPVKGTLAESSKDALCRHEEEMQNYVQNGLYTSSKNYTSGCIWL